MLLWSLHPERHKYVCVHFSVSMYIPNFCINKYGNHATNYSFTVSHALTFWYIIIMKIFQASLFCVLELHFLVLCICLHVGKPNTVNYAKGKLIMDRILSESLNDRRSSSAYTSFCLQCILPSCTLAVSRDYGP